MASSLRLIASNLVTRSPFFPTVVSASRFLSIDAGHPTLKDDFSGQPSVRIMCPKISSMSFTMKMDDENRSLKLEIPNDGLSVILHKPGLNKKDMRPCAAKQNNLSPDHKTGNEIKKEMEDGMLKVTLPNDKSTNIILSNMASDIITSFCDITAKRSWSYYDMFSDRSILGEGLCRFIAMSSPISSFTLEKSEYDLRIQMSIPGEEEMKSTTQGLRVSVRLFGIRRENVKTFFDYNTFFIEGKTKGRHHITGIHLPEGFHMRHNMIKRKMIGDVFYAFLSSSGKNNEQVLEQLMLKNDPPLFYTGVKSKTIWWK